MDRKDKLTALVLLAVVVVMGASLLYSRHSQGQDQALARALDRGDLTGVRTAIGRGADINTPGGEGNTALILASWQGDPEWVQEVIDLGADLNARSRDGSTALMCAVESGNAAVVRLLLQHGADPSIRGRYGYTPVMSAKLLGRTQIGKLLQAPPPPRKVRTARQVSQPGPGLAPFFGGWRSAPAAMVQATGR